MTSELTAAVDPWLLLDLGNGELALYGYCHGHHRLGGLSWILSSALRHLDEAAGTARTRSGTLYLLGRRIRVDDLPDGEAIAALEELANLGSPGSDSARAWLTACKTARWLRLAPPQRSDAAAVDAFLRRHRVAYLSARRGAKTATGSGVTSSGRARLETGNPGLPSADEGGIHATASQSTADEAVIFRARHRDRPVTVARAGRDEVVALTGENGSEPVRDRIDAWSLIAIHGLSRGTKVHALGWRVNLANTWITSPVATISLGPISVSTASGHAYRLMSPDEAQLRLVCREHLGHALVSWGFHDIRPE